jgi:hypothetical protein
MQIDIHFKKFWRNFCVENRFLRDNELKDSIFVLFETLEIDICSERIKSLECWKMTVLKMKMKM